MVVLYVDASTKGGPTDVTISLACIIQASENMFLADVSTLLDVSNLDG